MENTRAGLRQNVPMEAIHILACTEKPGLDQIEVNGKNGELINNLIIFGRNFNKMEIN